MLLFCYIWQEKEKNEIPSEHYSAVATSLHKQPQDDNEAFPSTSFL